MTEAKSAHVAAPACPRVRRPYLARISYRGGAERPGRACRAAAVRGGKCCTCSAARQLHTAVPCVAPARQTRDWSLMEPHWKQGGAARWAQRLAPAPAGMRDLQLTCSKGGQRRRPCERSLCARSADKDPGAQRELAEALLPSTAEAASSATAGRRPRTTGAARLGAPLASLRLLALRRRASRRASRHAFVT